MSHIQEGGERRRDINVPEKIVREEGGEKMKEKERGGKKGGTVGEAFYFGILLFQSFSDHKPEQI
jgi:hypothetical protein